MNTANSSDVHAQEKTQKASSSFMIASCRISCRRTSKTCGCRQSRGLAAVAQQTARAKSCFKLEPNASDEAMLNDSQISHVTDSLRCGAWWRLMNASI